MERVFADTGYWIALLNPRDDLHAIAAARAREYRKHRIVTSEMVLTEFLNSFSDFGPHLRTLAARAVETLRGSNDVQVIPQSSQLFARALRRYQEMSDKNWSLTDCASFLIMEEEGLVLALTHDQHFVQAGFQALLR